VEASCELTEPGEESLLYLAPFTERGSDRPPDSGAHDVCLLRLIAADSQEAMAEFYELHGRVVLAQILLVVRERALAEEILQDTMLAVWHGAGAFRGESRVRSWVISIARRQARDRLRRRRLRVVADDCLTAQPSLAPGPDVVALDRAEAAAVAKAIRGLTPAHREVLGLAFGTGLSLPEVADVLDVPLGTVKSRLTAARAALRRALACVAAAIVVAAGCVTYGLTRSATGTGTGSAVTNPGLSAVTGCPGLAAGTGIVQRVTAAGLVIRTPGDRLVTVKLATSGEVRRESVGSVSDITDGARVFVRGVYANGKVLAYTVTLGVERRLPSPVLRRRTSSPARQLWIGTGTVGDVSGGTFRLVGPGGRAVTVRVRSQAHVFSLKSAALNQLSPGDYVVAVGRASPNGLLVATTIDTGASLPHNRANGISKLPRLNCRPAAIAAALMEDE
jgi:RNA polymerase sigma-70 factor (ECF subfamily)